MAAVTFRFYDVGDNLCPAGDVLSFELTQDTDAACDGLRLRLAATAPLCEIRRVEAYRNNDLIFSGYCDWQKEMVDAAGSSAALYARSAACLAVDNEAKPATFYAPSALSLFETYIAPFGFRCALPPLSCEDAYRVSKGTSCWGAVDCFVHMLTGKHMLLLPDGTLTLPRGNRFDLHNVALLREERVIRRGAPVSRVDYKLDGDSAYLRHLQSKTMEEKGIVRTRIVNVASLPPWQRAWAVSRQLRLAGEEYCTAVPLFEGIHPFLLGSTVTYDGHFGRVTGEVSSVCITANGDSATTKIQLHPPMDLKEITYVAE